MIIKHQTNKVSKIISFLYTITTATLTYLWFLQVYEIYFETRLSDQVGLAFTLMLSLILGLRYLQLSKPLIFTFILLGHLTVLLTLPLFIPYLIAHSNYNWYFVHLSLAFCGLAVSQFHVWWQYTPMTLCGIAVWLLPYHLAPAQKQYHDKLHREVETRDGSEHVIRWKDDDWHYYNGILQYASIDEHMYAESSIHPAMQLGKHQSILIIGLQDPGLIREVHKYPAVKQLYVSPLDAQLWEQQMDRQKLDEQPFTIPTQLVPTHSLPGLLADTTVNLDLLLVDLSPTAALTALTVKPYFATSFYEDCQKKLTDHGLLVSRSYNAYLQQDKHQGHIAQLSAMGFQVVPYHTQIPTLGECNWLIASNSRDALQIQSILTHAVPQVATKWWNQEAMRMMLSYGKRDYFEKHASLTAQSSNQKR